MDVTDVSSVEQAIADSAFGFGGIEIVVTWPAATPITAGSRRRQVRLEGPTEG